jgi:hypothetical protein
MATTSLAPSSPTSLLWPQTNENRGVERDGRLSPAVEALQTPQELIELLVIDLRKLRSTARRLVVVSRRVPNLE